MNRTVKMGRRLSVLGLCSTLVMYSVQTVAGGQSFEDAFADVVCSNGWVACLADGDELTVDSVQDSRGILQNPSSRVSFFDFALLFLVFFTFIMFPICCQINPRAILVNICIHIVNKYLPLVYWFFPVLPQ